MYVQPNAAGRGYDTGIRGITIKFSKRDFDHFSTAGCYATAMMNLTYKLPNYDKTFKRTIFGYSLEPLIDELKCSKDKQCENLPESICSSCGSLVCDEHSRKCEVCGAINCKECSASKGLLTKHYYCSKCKPI